MRILKTILLSHPFSEPHERYCLGLFMCPPLTLAPITDLPFTPATTPHCLLQSSLHVTLTNHPWSTLPIAASLSLTRLLALTPATCPHCLLQSSIRLTLTRKQKLESPIIAKAMLTLSSIAATQRSKLGPEKRGNFTVGCKT